ncbi:hypothetical protein FKM82_005466 [Ascaphus truei]
MLYIQHPGFVSIGWGDLFFFFPPLTQGWATPVFKGHNQVRFSGYPCVSTDGSPVLKQTEPTVLKLGLIEPAVLKLGYPEHLTCWRLLSTAVARPCSYPICTLSFLQFYSVDVCFFQCRLPISFKLRRLPRIRKLLFFLKVFNWTL